MVASKFPFSFIYIYDMATNSLKRTGLHFHSHLAGHPVKDIGFGPADELSVHAHRRECLDAEMEVYSRCQLPVLNAWPIYYFFVVVGPCIGKLAGWRRDTDTVDWHLSSFTSLLLCVCASPCVLCLKSASKRL